MYSEPSERIVLANAFREDRGPLINRMMSLLSAEDFYLEQHRTLWGCLRTLSDSSLPHDVTAVLDYCNARQLFVGGVEYLAALQDDALAAAAGEQAVDAAAKRIKDWSTKRRFMEVCRQGMALCSTPGEPDEIMGAVEDDLRNLRMLSKSASTGPQHISTSVLKVLDTIQRQLDGEPILAISTGFDELDGLIYGLSDGDLIVLAARPSMGKAQPLDAQIRTSEGWVAMGDLKPGDALASVDGGASAVRAIYPQGRRQTYRVTFSDGRSAECCGEHLWKVMHRHWTTPRVVATAQLMTMLAKRRYQNRLWIETHTGDFGSSGDLPIDPWVLGAMLGDGGIGTSDRLQFSTTCEHTLKKMRERTEPTMEVKHIGSCNYTIIVANQAPWTGRGTARNPLTDAMRTLGLWGLRSQDKFIPAVYMNARRQVRLELLRGLLDTDGWVEKWGSIRFVSSSQRLAQDVVDLARSLGAWCSVTRKRTSAVKDGVRRLGLPSWVCHISARDSKELFSAPSKVARCKASRLREKRLTVTSIEPSRIVDCQCIEVTHPSHLYITNQDVVTHNTAAALNMSVSIGRRQGPDVTDPRTALIFSTEMVSEALARRSLATCGRLNLSDIRRGDLGESDFSRLSEAMEVLQQSGIYIDDTPGISLHELRSRARAHVAKHGKCVIVVDYLQNLGNTDGLDTKDHVSRASNGLKMLARELGCPVVALSQLSRSLEQRANKRPLMSDLRESGTIEQDADVVIFIYRDEYYNPDTKDPGVAEWIVAKQRDGAVGTVKLAFDKATQHFYPIRGF